MKGMILAGGLGTRLYPVTLSTCKQLLPIYDKPMIYYPLSVLMLAEIRDILLITSHEDQSRFQSLLGDGSHLGVSLSYATQPEPNGIAQSFLIGEGFIGSDAVALILGDNIFHGHDLKAFLHKPIQRQEGGRVFGYEVADPSRYGVLGFDASGRVNQIVEKPKEPPSKYAVTGLYFYDNDVVEMAKSLAPSWRNEYEITDINQAYLENDALHVSFFDRGFVWLDTGTPDAFHKASSYVQTIQERQGVKVGCVEEIAYEMGFIDISQLERLATHYRSSEYGAYLKGVCNRQSEMLEPSSQNA